MEDVEDWVEQEIRRQLQELTTDDLEEQLDGGHELGCHGDKQSVDADSELHASENAGDLEDLNSTVFSSYLAKLDEYGGVAHDILEDAQQVLLSLREYQQGGEEDSCGHGDVQTRDTFSTTSSPSVLKSGNQHDVPLTGPPAAVVRQLSPCETGRQLRRRNVTITAQHKMTVATDRRHSWDVSTGNRSSVLLYDPREEIFVKCSDLGGPHETQCNQETEEDTISEPDEELDTELRLIQKKLDARALELRKQRNEHDKLLEDRHLQLLAEHTRAAVVLQAAIRGWIARKHVQPLIQEKIRLRQQQEEKQAWRITMLQSRCKGHLLRTALSKNILTLRETRKANREAFVRVVMLLQAAARGWLLREQVKKDLHRWRHLRRRKDITSVTRLQAKCRGYLLRRITTDILRDLQQTRLRETKTDKKGQKDLSRLKEQVYEKSKKARVTREETKERERKKTNKLASGKTMEEKPKGRSKKQSPTRWKESGPKKQITETTIILLQARARGLAARRNLLTMKKQIAEDELSKTSEQYHTRPEIQQEHLELATKKKQQQPVLSTEKKQQQPVQSTEKKQQQPVQSTEKKQQQPVQSTEKRQQQPVQSTEKKQQQPVQSTEKRQQQPVQSTEKKQCHQPHQLKPEETEQEGCAISVEMSMMQRNQQDQHTGDFNLKLNKEVSLIDHNIGDVAEVSSDLLASENFKCAPKRMHSNQSYLEQLARSGRERSTYLAELDHASQPMSGCALLGLVHERMARWQDEHKKRRRVHRDSKAMDTCPPYTAIQTQESRDSPLTHESRDSPLTHEIRDSPLTCENRDSPLTCESRDSPFTCECSGSPLTHAQLVRDSPEGTSLDAVVQVSVSGCGLSPALSSMKACPMVCSLSVTQCDLQVLTGLQNCPHLCQLNVSGNKIKQVCLGPGGCGKLCFVDLSDNRMASIHGLEHCQGLLHLSLARNRLARVSNLKYNPHITQLNLDQNMLINCKGVEVLTELEVLSMCDNHLLHVDGLEGCLCLQHLLLSQNNLQQIPVLDSHVLLTDLRLDENNLSDTSAITSAWLPRLRTLSLANNCVSKMDGLACLLLLTSLNLAYNSIYDLPVLLQAVNGCFNLKVLCVAGNPVAEEPDVKNLVHSAVPSLQTLDDYHYNIFKLKQSRVPDVIATSLVYRTCKEQEERELKMKEKQRNTLTALGRVGATRDINAACAVLEARIRYCHDYHSVVKQHLLELVDLEEQPAKKQQHQSVEHQSVEHQSVEHQSVEHQGQPLLGSTAVNQVKLQEESQIAGVETQDKETIDLAHSIYAATRLQALWRGVLARKKVKELRRQKSQEEERNKAATTIQAMFRGYLLRTHLHHILKVSSEDKWEEFSEDQLLHFFDESDLEKELDEDFGPLSLDGSTTRTSDLPVAVPVKDAQANKPGSSYKKSLRSDEVGVAGSRNYTPAHSGEVLLPGSSSPVQLDMKLTPGQLTTTTNTYCPHSVSSHPSPHSLPQLTPQPEASAVMEAWGSPEEKDKKERTRSESIVKLERRKTRQQELTKEWGFSSTATTHLMLKRAQRQKKLEQSALNRKLMADPAVRLARFRRHGHHHQTKRKEHSTNRDLENSVSSSSSTGQSSQVFRWLHHRSECKQHSAPGSNPLAPSHPYHNDNGHTHSASQSNSMGARGMLPDMEPHILAGYSTRLMSSESLNKLVLNGDNPFINFGSKLTKNSSDVPF